MKITNSPPQDSRPNLLMERITTSLIAIIALGTNPIAAAEPVLIPVADHSCQGCYLGASMAASDLNPGVGQSGHTLNGRWVSSSQTATSPNQGDPITLSWGFVKDNTNVTGPGGFITPYEEYTAPSTFIDFLDDTFGNGVGDPDLTDGGPDLTTRPWFAKFDNSFKYISNICGLNLVYEPEDDGVNFRGSYKDAQGVTQNSNGIDGTRADIRIAGAGFYGAIDPTVDPIADAPLDPTKGPPIGSPIANANGVGTGEVLYNINNLGIMQQTSFVGNPVKGDRAYRNVTMHEVMHSVGVSHNSIAASTTPLVPSNNTLINPTSTTVFDGLQHLDILPLQRAYGDIYETGNGNDAKESATQIGDILDFQGIGLDGDIPFGQVTPNNVDFVSIDGNMDTDYYEFTVSESGAVDIILKPLGLEFNASTGDLVNTAALSDLTLELWDSTSVAPIASSTGGGLGEMESIMDKGLSPGNYFIKVVGSQDFAQFYSITSTFTPSGPYLLISSPDGGEAWVRGNQNNITWRSNITENIKIEILMGGSVSTIAANTPNDGSYLWTIPSTQEVADNYKIRVTSIDTPDKTKTDQSADYFSITLTPLATALDTTDLVWLSEEPFSWFKQEVTTKDGVDAAMSQDINDDESCSMETTLQGPGELTFWWLVSSEKNYDFLEFYINNIRQERISGKVGWEQKTFVIPAGTHTVRWTYAKDDQVSGGDDAGYVDQVVFTPPPTPYSTWAGGTFAKTFNDTSPSSDPDGDGLTNKMEFAFGLDPTDSSVAPLDYTLGGGIIVNGMPILQELTLSGSNPKYHAVFIRRKDYATAGLTYSVEFSAKLGQWTRSGVTPTVLTGIDNPGDYEVVCIPYPATVPANNNSENLQPQFFRVAVE